MLLLSHGDYDHVGGAASLSRSITVKKLLLPALVPEEREHNHLERIVALSQETAVSGSRYSCGGAELEILYAPVGEQGNTASVVAALYGRKGRMLFTGDADAAEEESLPLAGLRGCEVLKVAHHGSRYSSSPEFLQRLGPQLAVISVGRGNTYGHPHRESLARLAAAGSTVLRTDELGAVKVVFDGERTKWYSYLYQMEDF